MQTKLVMLALLGLAGCKTSYGPDVYVRSETAINIRGTPDRRQAIEDTAVAHCAARNLVPRLVDSGPYVSPGLDAPGSFYRFECQARPR